MGFNSYRGTLKLGAGLTPSGSGYPLMQSCDIQVDESGKRLDTLLSELSTALRLPVEVSTEMEMTRILSKATSDNIGEIYKYIGETTDTYEYGGLYIIAEEA